MLKRKGESLFEEKFMDSSKEKKIVVITGASSGIGKGLKELFLLQGHRVIGLSRTDCGEGFVKCDVTDRAAVFAAISEIGQKYGRIDLLINNAGVGISGAAELADYEDFRRVMQTNVDGTLNVSQAALAYMGRGGKIVNVSSVCALFALPFRTVYCAAKAAESMLSYGMRMELAHGGITVVTVCPGEIKTGFTANRIKNFKTNARYGDRIERAARRIDEKEEKRMDCAKACRKIFKIALKKKGARYIIGGKYKALDFISRFLPAGVFLSACSALMGGK